MFRAANTPVMNLTPMTDKAIAAEIGARFRALRLKKNLTIEMLAKNVMLSETTIKHLEKGQAKLSTMIAVLRELRELNNLNFFIQIPQIEPMMLLEMQGKQRLRASKSTHHKQNKDKNKDKDKDKETPSW
ncbi:MAG TPA: XRE family transcriptional regulator [Methylococcaceae bacterium]|nr:XRE family transcriptional regulator [Methylococcaceae bacterium]